MTVQLWVDLPPDMLEKLYRFQGEFWLEARQRGYVVKDIEYPDVDGVSR